MSAYSERDKASRFYIESLMRCLLLGLNAKSTDLRSPELQPHARVEIDNYRAGLAMKSRYAHRLHEMIAFRSGREKQVESFTVEALRARLGVQIGRLMG